MLKNFFILTCVCVFLLASVTQAGPLDRMEHYTLPNGLQVYLLPRPTSIINSVFGYKAGGKQEWIGATGLAHYLEHCTFLGTKKYSEAYTRNFTQVKGGWSNAGTNKDFTIYLSEFPESLLPDVLDFEADRMQNLVFPEDSIKKAREVIQEEMHLYSENDLDGRRYDETIQALFRDSSYSWPLLGKIGDIPQLSRDDLVKFYKEHYHPCNATLIIFGGIDVQKTKALINKYFASIPSGTPTIYPRTPEPKLDGKRIRILHGNTDLPMYSIAWLTVPTNHPDYLALQLLAIILSGGSSARLDKLIVFEESLFSNVSAYNRSYVQNGFFNIIGVATSTANLPKAENAITEEIQKIAINGIEEKELNTAKNIYLSNNVFNLQDHTSFAFEFYTAVLNNTLDELKDLNGSLNKVTPADIQRVAKQYLSPDDYVTVSILPWEKENEN